MNNSIVERLARRAIRSYRGLTATPPGQRATVRTAFVTSDSLPAPAQAASVLSQSRVIGPAQIQRLDKILTTDDAQSVARVIVCHVGAHPESADQIAPSHIHVAQEPRSHAAALIHIAGNYVIGRADRSVAVARDLVQRWPSDFAHVLLARCLEQAESAAAEHDALRAGLSAFPESRVLRLNLIENLIGTDRVDDANAETQPILDSVKVELADEIATVVKNQADLDKAIVTRAFAPEGDGDIYTDEFCRAYWHSYFQSYVMRSEHFHGDRLLLRKFVRWVESMKDDIDVLLDFGCLCAQPLYEAAEIAPNVKIIGTDRQEFLADMNRTAYPLPNIAFDAGDIFEVMERTAKLPGRKAFSHVRTTCTLYPELVDRVYAAAARIGYQHIYLIENSGWVRSQLRFLPFHGMNAEAVVTKHRLNYHNYSNLLAKHGYRIEAVNRIRAPGLWRGDDAANMLGSQLEIHATLN